MHYAQQQRKCLLHRGSGYALCMSTPSERLRQARTRAGFLSAAAAAKSMGIPEGTYAGHENGHRGFPAKSAPQYARKFKVSEEWLLYGKGSIDDVPDERIDIPSVEQLEEMVRLALMEVQPGARLADYPPIVASSLHDQLELLQAHGVGQAGDRRSGKAISPGTGVRPRAPTSASGREE